MQRGSQVALYRRKHGHIHLTGHRIGLEEVVFYYRDGESPKMLLGRFPTLSLALLHKTIAFYLENQAEVMATSRARIRKSSGSMLPPGSVRVRRNYASASKPYAAPRGLETCPCFIC